MQYHICRYRRKRDKLVEKAAAAPIPTMWGPFTAYCFRSLLDGMEHIAMVKVSKKLNWQTYKSHGSVSIAMLYKCLFAPLSFLFFLFPSFICCKYSIINNGVYYLYRVKLEMD